MSARAEFIWLIVNARSDVKDLGNLGGAQPVRHPHLIEIGIGNKGEQAAVLVLPAEASDAGLSGSLENRRPAQLPCTLPSLDRLFRRDCDQSLVVNRFSNPSPGVEGTRNVGCFPSQVWSPGLTDGWRDHRRWTCQ